MRRIPVRWPDLHREHREYYTARHQHHDRLYKYVSSAYMIAAYSYAYVPLYALCDITQVSVASHVGMNMILGDSSQLAIVLNSTQFFVYLLMHILNLVSREYTQQQHCAGSLLMQSSCVSHSNQIRNVAICRWAFHLKHTAHYINAASTCDAESILYCALMHIPSAP